MDERARDAQDHRKLEYLMHFDQLSLASREARRLHQKTGLEYHVIATACGNKWFVVREVQADMVVWRTIKKKNKLFS